MLSLNARGVVPFDTRLPSVWAKHENASLVTRDRRSAERERRSSSGLDPLPRPVRTT